MSVIEDIKKFLKGLPKEQQTEFMRQLLAEKDLQDTFRAIGFTGEDVESQTLRESSRERPKQVLSIDEATSSLDRLKFVEDIGFPSLISHGDFRLGDLTNWVSNSASIDKSVTFGDLPTVKLDKNASYIIQYLNPFYADEVAYTLWALTNNKTTATLTWILYFTDGMFETADLSFAQADAFELKTILPTTHKRVMRLILRNNSSPTDISIWVGSIKGYPIMRKLTSTDQIMIYNAQRPTTYDIYTQIRSNGVEIDPRYREDLVFQRFANTFAAAGDYQILAANATKHHKVFSYGVRASADVEVFIRDGVSVNRQIGIDNKATLRVQTLHHPFVGEINNPLNLRAEGAVSVVGWIQYVTEA